MSEEIFKLAVDVLTAEIDKFISACLDDAGMPKSPNQKDNTLIRACLPPGYQNSFKKRG